MGPGRSSELPSIPSMNPSIWRRLSVSHRATHRIFPRVSGSTNTRRLSGPHQHPDRNKITHHLLIRILDSLCVRAKSLQSCLTLCNPTDCSLPGPSVHGILQAKILEWVAMPSSRGSFQPRDRTLISCILHLQVGSLPLAPPGKPPKRLSFVLFRIHQSGSDRLSVQFSSVQWLSHVRLFATP